VCNTGTVSRVSGDEYAIILTENMNLNELHKAAENILDIFQKTFEIKDKRFTVTASIGACQYPIYGIDADSLIAKADMAMY
ncbi:diguanylate cyclase domain-containing protein, partial [Pseudomonas sp. 2822-15]|uniref:diguanylate cyclase domain-containing protein n=1 Tax=Pseudomonas sp. 2822-15 TaxID=1712677 RepID=UPI001179EA06